LVPRWQEIRNDKEHGILRDSEGGGETKNCQPKLKGLLIDWRKRASINEVRRAMGEAGAANTLGPAAGSIGTGDRRKVDQSGGETLSLLEGAHWYWKIRGKVVIKRAVESKKR